jgi:hypothetical protein
MYNYEYILYGYLIYSIIFTICFPKVLALMEKNNDYYPNSIRDGELTWRYVFRGVFLSLIPTMNLALPCGGIVVGIFTLYDKTRKSKWLDKKVFK